MQSAWLREHAHATRLRHKRGDPPPPGSSLRAGRRLCAEPPPALRRDAGRAAAHQWLRRRADRERCATAGAAPEVRPDPDIVPAFRRRVPTSRCSVGVLPDRIRPARARRPRAADATGAGRRVRRGAERSSPPAAATALSHARRDTCRSSSGATTSADVRPGRRSGGATAARPGDSRCTPLLRSARIVLNRHIAEAGPFANNMRLYESTGVGLAPAHGRKGQPARPLRARIERSSSTRPPTISWSGRGTSSPTRTSGRR